MTTRIASLLKQAQEDHQAGRLAQAEQAYVEILAQQPQHFDALHLIGAIAHQRGDHQSAMQFYGKALQVNPQHAQLYHNLASCLHQLERHEEALLSVDSALKLDKAYVLAWVIRGTILAKLRRFQEAMASFETAMELRIDAVEAYYERGLCLQYLDMDNEALLDFEDGMRFQQSVATNRLPFEFARGFSLHKLGRYDEARSAYQAALADPHSRQASLYNLALLEANAQRLTEALSDLDALLLLDAQHRRAHLQRGHVLRQLSRIDEAAAAYRSAARHGLSQEQLDFLLASLGHTASPAMAPTTYIRDLFDHYAPHFEQHLKHNLNYRLPEILASRLQHFVKRPAARMLDLGCGTGLCGALLREYGGQLVGVDLSPEMLARAATREVYDELVCDEVQHYLAQQTKVVDLILCADVLVYIGDLERLFTHSHRLLKGGGLIFFTVECNDASSGELGYQLQSHQRYAHHIDYLKRIARTNSWDILEMESHALRREGEQMSQSLVCVWRKI